MIFSLFCCKISKISLSVISNPETPRVKWYEDGKRRSIGGVQTFLAEETTRARLFLTPKGLYRYDQDDKFRNLLGVWVTKQASSKVSTTDVANETGLKTIRSSRSNEGGWSMRFASVFKTQDETDVVVKSFDYRPRLASIQFDAMTYIANRLNLIEAEPEIKAPFQYGLVLPRRDTPAVFMEEVPGEKEEIVEPEVRDIIFDRLGVFGGMLTNDFANYNLIVDRPQSGASTHYLID